MKKFQTQIRTGRHDTVTEINGTPVEWRGPWLRNRISTKCWNEKHDCSKHISGPVVPKDWKIKGKTVEGMYSHGICPGCHQPIKEMINESKRYKGSA